MAARAVAVLGDVFGWQLFVGPAGVGAAVGPVFLGAADGVAIDALGEGIFYRRQ